MMINGKRLSDRKGTSRTRGKEINVQKVEWEKRSGYLGEKLFSWTQKNTPRLPTLQILVKV